MILFFKKNENNGAINRITACVLFLAGCKYYWDMRLLLAADSLPAAQTGMLKGKPHTHAAFLNSRKRFYCLCTIHATTPVRCAAAQQANRLSPKNHIAGGWKKERGILRSLPA
jgi:hypothetical protein